MSDYSKGKIYRLLCDDPNLVYYGSTVRELEKRLIGHTCKSNSCSSKILVEAGGIRIELVENYPCNSKAELELREKMYIRSNNCVNITNNKRKYRIKCRIKRIKTILYEEQVRQDEEVRKLICK